MIYLIYALAVVGAFVVGAILFLLGSWLFIRTVARAQLRRKARLAALTTP